MRHVRIRQNLMVAIALAAILVPALAGAQTAVITSKLAPPVGAYDLGLIFNTSDILFDLDSYQAGFGVKRATPNLGLRGAFDFVWNGAAQSFAVKAGIALEKHLVTGAISPYWGGFVNAGYSHQTGVISAVPVSLGAMAGVEVFLFDFLSIFAEYCLAADLSLIIDHTSSTTTFDYVIDTRMGNDSRIGIVFYLQRMEAKKPATTTQPQQPAQSQQKK